MRRLLVPGRPWLALLPVLTLGVSDCYSTGDGSPPPLKEFYFPVGLQVSAGGRVLYAVNSDFDLQYNGGTIQSYDLRVIRDHAVASIADIARRKQETGVDPCAVASPTVASLGETCAPPVDSKPYVQDTALIGAFATDLVLSKPPAQLVAQTPLAANEANGCPDVAGGCPTPPPGDRKFDRLFIPVRGNASLTWASVRRDDPVDPDPPFTIECGQDSSRRCNDAHTAGEDPSQNNRHITMPGEPFGMAMSEDGEFIAITHQGDTKASLFSTGQSRTQLQGPELTKDVPTSPALEFILDGVPFGGVGIAAVPHDRAAFLGAPALPRPAFLETNRYVAEVALLRQYPDQGGGAVALPETSSLRRPFLDREGVFPITVGAGGADSRGIAIDPTPRLACKAKVLPADPATGRTQPDVDEELKACGQKAARVFIANRSPASLLVGEIGGSSKGDTVYDPDRLVLKTMIPLSAGPSKVYLAPVVESDGALALRVFAVCFDSATVFVYNPDTQQLENVIRVGLGPFAMAFDPFTFEDVANHVVQVPRADGLRPYRFGYLASFTNSFVQILDLDNTQPPVPGSLQGSATFERIVFTLGHPQTPKGS